VTLGVDAVMMAVALEGAKPLAVASALAAFRARTIVRGLALFALAAAANRLQPHGRDSP
jgi:hypothetical protein